MSANKRPNLIADFFTILFGVFLIATLAQASMNFPLFPTEIPGTWQTFAVLVFSYSTNRWLGFWAVLVYLLAGIYGFPIFAEGAFGREVFLGPTGGYLTGFLVAAFVVGWLGEKVGWKENFLKSLVAMTIGTLIILVFGVVFLSNFIGFAEAINQGFLPFLLGAGIKIVLGAAIWSIYEWLQRYHAK